MKAAVYYENGPPEVLKYEDFPDPVCHPRGIVIRVEAVGICASDVKCFEGAPMFWGDATRPRYCEPPVVPGHELVGTVAEIDDEAGSRWGVRVGDRVVAEQIVPCEECRYCRRGQYWLCRRNDVFGFHQRTQGAMAEYMALPPLARAARLLVAGSLLPCPGRLPLHCSNAHARHPRPDRCCHPLRSLFPPQPGLALVCVALSRRNNPSSLFLTPLHPDHS